MPKKYRLLRTLSRVFVLLVVLFLGCMEYNKYMINNNYKMYKPLGKMVVVNGNNMCIYVEGGGDKTLVFMSGSGTSSPILDFISLARELKDDYRVVIVEKFGYGFSDITNESRIIEVILSETRAGLEAADVTSPYILCPHSMSGIEALYWVEKYPDEIEAIVGLDMAVKETYDNFKPSSTVLEISSLVARTGVLRYLPGVSESDAIKYGNLSDEEKNMYRTIFNQKTQTINMINEIKQISDNAKKLGSYSDIKIPVILFCSNGRGTGFEAEHWLKCQANFISQIRHGQMINLDCTHYVHDIACKKLQL